MRARSVPWVSVIRFTVVAAAAGVGFLAVGALWMSTCTGATAFDTAACGPVQHTVLDLGAPIILLIAAALAFWRGHGASWGAPWHGAGGILLVLTALTLIPVN
ncbi:hypothetical protein FHT40_002086 [Mycolicibacterium sp. BK556]|uniref:hypothetical protein n=1 Tax=Mycobacteriaceae TaxID=1762 RepID=UPI0010E56E18|nr:MULTISPECIES: hypothetical protein [Mycobacteriaceae]MBB3602453.1 hypothetical protein [Mycolicibacterium sp. BK556]MBB3632205.1 hypothetical protein [Mycolicibacterium sp. BK607]MBB3750226.1 hypothetical protein [Mycolicibacterium sp. BK634]TDO18505.1 hypothetical protein EV580_1692 [Mycobacterium sp. BK086]